MDSYFLKESILLIIAGCIGYFSAIRVQDRERNCNFRNMIKILYGEMESAYRILFIGDNQIYSGDLRNILMNYRKFNLRNYEAILPEIIGHKYFERNCGFFKKIDYIYLLLDEINDRINAMIPYKDDLNNYCVDHKKLIDLMDEVRHYYSKDITHSSNAKFEETELYKGFKSLF